MSNAKYWFGEPQTFWIPVMMLTLLIFSAAITGTLFFGLAFYTYFKGDKKDALKLVGFNLLFLFIFLIIAAIVVARG